MTADKLKRRDFICDTILKEFEVLPNQLSLWSKDENIAFAKCFIALILDEENFKITDIANYLKTSRISCYAKLNLAKDLLSVHPVFKSKYLKLIQIITADED